MMLEPTKTPRTKTAVKMTVSAGQLTISGGPQNEPLTVAPVALKNAQAQQIQARLNRLFEPAESRRWLVSPQKRLDGASPLALIERGEADRILRLLIRLEEGITL